MTLDAIMAQLQRINARLDTLSDELCQVNSCQPYCQMTGSPWWFRGVSLPSPEASEDDDDDFDDDDDEDGDASSPSDDEMST